MHVGVFLDDIRQEEGGGFTFVHDVVAAFLAEAAKSSHRFTLFCPPAYARAVAAGLPGNVSVAPIAPRGLLASAIAELRHASPTFAILWRRPSALERKALALGVDVMWFVGGAYDTLDMPYFTTVWDVQHRTHPWFPEVSARGLWDHREAFFRRHLARAALVITGTAVGRDELRQFYAVPPERVRILPHPTPVFALEGAAQPAPATPRGLAPGYFFYPAQFWPHKNHANLLHGYHRLRTLRPDAPKLVLSGSDKGNRAAIERLARELSLADSVHFLGFVSVAELVALYRNARALVYASFSGPENLPPLEAFALGCPVVASDFPGAREQLKDAALYFDPTDSETLAAALSRLIDDPSAGAGLVEKGRQRARSWTGREFVRGVFDSLDTFGCIRRAWP